MLAPVEAVLDICRPALLRSRLRLPELVSLAKSITLTDAQIDLLCLPDPTQPYGRRVLLADARLEVMVATWTPGILCAPHDHGGQIGAVQILRGSTRHHIWSVVEGSARCVRQHEAHRGEVLLAGPSLIHSMGCAGGAQPLVTLHLYTEAIPYMIVYDLPRGETVLVDSTCGAWVPAADTGQIISRLPGIWSRSAVIDWMAARGGFSHVAD